MRYTVVWQDDATDELALLWLAAQDQQAVANASDRIDQILADDPLSSGQSVAEGLFRLTVPPLRVLYAVREADQMVEVATVRSITGTE